MSDVENNATEDSLRDTLAAAFNGAQSNDSSEVVADDKAVVDSRARDDKGRFSNNMEQQSSSAKIDNHLPEGSTQTDIAPPAKKAPQSWKQELKENFSSLSPEIQDEILRRESDFNKGFQKYAEDAKYAQSMRGAVEQWMPYLSQLQITPEQAFQALIPTEYVLRTGSPAQKQQMLLKLANDYGINLGQPQEQQQNTYGSHSDVSYLTNQVSSLNQQIMQMQYEKQQVAQRQQQAEMAELQSQIDEFASKPEFSHFQDVREDMQALLANGRAQSLEDAYQKAVWANPDIRASLLKQEEAKRIQQQAEAANKAKSKALSITGSPSGAAVPIAGASIRDDLRAAFSAAGGRL